MPQPYCTQSTMPESYTRPGSNIAVGLTWPAPKLSGVAAETPLGPTIGLPRLSVWPAVVIMADLTAIGDQVGFLPINSAARPAMCGLDIDVPDSASYMLPWSPAG